MTDRTRSKESLKDRAEALVKGILEAIGELLPSQGPVLAPVPVRDRRRRYPR